MITSELGFVVATPTKCGTTTLEAVAKRHMYNAGADGDQFRICDWAKPRRQHSMSLPPKVQWDDYSPVVYRGIEYPLGAGIADADWEDHDRWILLRSPLARYASIYKYMLTPYNYSQWGTWEVQGSRWGGTNKEPRPGDPWTFGEFLEWFTEQRAIRSSGRWVKRRGPLDAGRAYRSPWVWLDPLDYSADLLASWGGSGDLVGVLRLETMWGSDGDLAGLRRMYAGVAGEANWLSTKEAHANPSMWWGREGGIGPSRRSEAGLYGPYLWGSLGLKCADDLFKSARGMGIPPELGLAAEVDYVEELSARLCPSRVLGGD